MFGYRGAGMVPSGSGGYETGSGRLPTPERNGTMSDESKNHEESGEESRIKVTDRRLFTSDGELRDHGGAGEPEPDVVMETDRPGEEAGFSHTPVEEDPGVDFTTLINAMATPALIHLGEVPHPDGGMSEVNLEQARLQIDFLALLQVKCRGNLSSAEESLLERVLYQLRLLYVSKSGKAGSAQPPAPTEG